MAPGISIVFFIFMKYTAKTQATVTNNSRDNTVFVFVSQMLVPGKKGQRKRPPAVSWQ
jgi:hypothetical protein